MSQEEIRRGQNRAKRAIAEEVAQELGSMKASLDKTAERLGDVCATLSSNWEGAAAEAFLKTIQETAVQLNELGNEAKTVSAAIKSAAQSVYPD